MVYKASVGTIQLQQQEDKHFDWRGPVVKKNVKHHKSQDSCRGNMKV